MELMSSYINEHGLEVKKGIVPLLEFLKERGILTAVATATDYERTEDYLTRAGLFGRFDRIICASMVACGKPMPDIYIYAARQLGLDTGLCMALEDSPNGVRSACAAGCVTVMVPDLTPPDSELMSRVYAVAENAGDVIAIIENYKEGGEKSVG